VTVWVEEFLCLFYLFLSLLGNGQINLIAFCNYFATPIPKSIFPFLKSYFIEIGIFNKNSQLSPLLLSLLAVGDEGWKF